MGEYAKRRSDGQEVKIGTCEDMYYLRAEQRHSVTKLPNSLDPASEAFGLRFRFPWPDEDGTLPGAYDGPFLRSVHVPGYIAPVSVKHESVQFSAPAGYVVSLPCPEGHPQQADFLTIHRNGFAGAVQLTQQKLLANGRLVPVLQCGGCGAAWREEEQTEIEALALAFRTEGDTHERRGDGLPSFWHAIADRLLLGARILALPSPERA